MRRIREVLPAGHWDAGRAVGSVTLGWDDRHRRRIRLTTDQGEAVLLDLAETARLGDGDGLVLADGGLIRVVAAHESVMMIGPGTAGLARLAYHLGNRHLPIEIGERMLVIRADAVIADMVRGLGGTVEAVERPFMPEAGAYGGGHGHGHDHDDHHDHDYGHPERDHHHDHDHHHGHDHRHG